MATDTAERPRTAKDEVKQVLDSLPDDSSFEEIVSSLSSASSNERLLERALADADAGRTLSNEEMKQRIASWAR